MYVTHPKALRWPVLTVCPVYSLSGKFFLSLCGSLLSRYTDIWAATGHSCISSSVSANITFTQLIIVQLYCLATLFYCGLYSIVGSSLTPSGFRWFFFILFDSYTVSSFTAMQIF